MGHSLPAISPHRNGRSSCSSAALYPPARREALYDFPWASQFGRASIIQTASRTLGSFTSTRGIRQGAKAMVWRLCRPTITRALRHQLGRQFPPWRLAARQERLDK